MAYHARRTEHAGAKNGGGYWGHRAEAKHESSHQRRVDDRRVTELAQVEYIDVRVYQEVNPLRRITASTKRPCACGTPGCYDLPCMCGEPDCTSGVGDHRAGS